MSVNSPEEMLRLYQEAAQLTSRLVEEARAEQWDRVTLLGRQYVDIIDTIKGMAEVRPLTEEERLRKHDLIVSILANDNATRELVQPQMTRLSHLLGSMRRQQSLIDSYGAQAAVAP